MKWYCPLCDYVCEKNAWNGKRDKCALANSRSNHYRKHKVRTFTIPPHIKKLNWSDQDRFIKSMVEEHNHVREMSKVS